ncbi:MAG: HNH endonuclease [Pyrinomonadaceae bacterium]|nr:HNH endonuclease [Pyrinomonadaceae bacterium]
MNLNEAAALLQLNRDTLKVAIEIGIELPISKKNIKLKSVLINKEIEVEESDLDEYINAFHNEEPGRHPPAAVRRELLVDANHLCAICKRDAPIEFHHIVEYSEIKHYDVKHMLAICPNCHARCTLGEIDRKAQYEYKRRLKDMSLARKNDSIFIVSNEPIRFSWEELKDLIIFLRSTITFNNGATSESKYDFSETEIEEKNRLNKLGNGYFDLMKEEYEPYFGEINNFLKSPVNSEISELYYELVDEIRQKIAADREKFDRFEQVLIDIVNAASIAWKEESKGKRRTLNVLLSFMYFECDIGRKK